MRPLLLPLSSTDNKLETCGGKAANLGELIRAGFPVPAGFALTTDAYRAFVRANGIGERIVELAAAVRADHPESFEYSSRRIRQLFASAAIPEDIVAVLRSGYADLCAGRRNDPGVAVRSSATAEDLAGASFAGQQETFLNVRGEAALLDAVKKCWSSLWTARAIAYRARQGIAPGAVALAVVVQDMAPAHAAGVLFTLNPVTGDQDEMLINAAWGLGEAVVAGQVNPDSVTVDKVSLKIRHVEVGDKIVMTAPAVQGTTDLPVDRARQRKEVLTPEQVSELVRLAVEIERHFGVPQDIEWAFAGERAFVLQSRPVTAVAPPPVPAPPVETEATQTAWEAVPGDDAWSPQNGDAPMPFDVWTQSDMGERWPEPVTPLTWSAWEPITNDSMRESFRATRARDLSRIRWARRAYGRVYFNEGAMAELMAREYGMPYKTIAPAMGTPEGVAPTDDGYKWGLILRRLPMFLGMMRKWSRDEKAYPARFPQIDRWVDDFMRRDLAAEPDAALWDEAQRTWMPRAMESIHYHGEITGMSMTSLPQLESLVERWHGKKETARALVNGLTGVIASEIVPSLWAMAREAERLGVAEVITGDDSKQALSQLRANPKAKPLMDRFDAFLQRHGHRCATEAEWRYPRWSEAPEQVVELIASHIRNASLPDPGEAEAEVRRKRDALQAEVERKLGPIRRGFFRNTLERTRHLTRLRDNGQNYLVKLLMPVRRLYATLGERWTSRGWLERGDDFFFLVISEIEAVIASGDPAKAGLDLRRTVRERRKAYEHWFGVSTPEVLDRDGKPVGSPQAHPNGAALVGIPASSGEATGTARVVANPREASSRLKIGDILVTRATDPGWTPVFSLVRGIVLEVGGQLSHGAIVAREYGIPAVVNVPEATRRIPDGQTVTVDGTHGRVQMG